MNPIENIGYGIISGILSSFIVLAVTGVIRKYLIPMYQDFVYRGVYVDGKWSTKKTFHEGKFIQEELLSISQNANKLTGIRVLTKKSMDNGNLVIKNYKIFGEIKDRYVHLYTYNEDKRKIGISCGLYEVGFGGEILKGKEIWADVGSNNLDSEEVILRRQEG